MRSFPAGTVTFLFTDIEGSTRLLHELGAERYAEALAEHRRVLRAAFARHEGVEVDTQGDAFFVAFASAPAALAAAREALAGLQDGPVRVRAGVHTGTPLVTEEGYVGVDVHRAARIAAAAHGEQIVISDATRALVGDADLRDLGEHRLKDLAAPERLWQLSDRDFPPLASLYRTNFPVPATPFLGRDSELAAATALLTRDDVRLATLVGPGGTGKTRLALQAAAEVAERFPDGMTWVPLASLGDASLVPATIARAMELRTEAGADLRGMLARALAGRRRLLLLDNAEHLLPALAAEVSALRAIDGPVLLVTSRERLQVHGEHVYGVPTMDDADGAALFTTRSRELGVERLEGGAVSELCERLDNLPLALELAAARTVLFSPEQLLDRLGERLDLLRGPRDADARQQTLRATLEWSHDLLGAEERRLFARLSVFAGGCTYEAAEAVAGADPDTLQSLVDKSLVRRRDPAPAPRFWMLETIREFAAERLAERSDATTLSERHGSFFADLVSARVDALRVADEAALAEVDGEIANIRAGLRGALARGDAALAAAYLHGMWFYWITQGLGSEAASAAGAWLALDRSALTPAHLASGLLGVSEILRFTGDPARAIEAKLEFMSLARENPNVDLHGRSRSGSRSLAGWMPGVLADLGFLLSGTGRIDEARAFAEEALAIRRAAGRPGGIAHAQAALVAVADAAGDFAEARRLAAAAAEGFEAAGARDDAFAARAVWAEQELLLGDVLAACRVLGEVASAARFSRDRGIHEVVLRVAATIAVNADEPGRAARLFGAAERLRTEGGIDSRDRPERERDERSLAWLRARVDAGTLERAGEADPTALLEEIGSWLDALTARLAPS